VIGLVQEVGGAGLDGLLNLVLGDVAGDASSTSQGARARLQALQCLVNVARPEVWSPTPGRTVPYPPALGGGSANSKAFTTLVAKLVEIIEAEQLRHAEQDHVELPAEMTAAALAALSNMAKDSVDRAKAIFNAGGVDLILSVESDGSARQKEEAAKLMQNLRLFKVIADQIAEMESAVVMLQRAQDANNVGLRARAMRTLALGLERSETMREQMRKSKGALKWAASILDSGEPEDVEQAAFVLASALRDAPKMQAEVARSKPTLDKLVALASGGAEAPKRHAVKALKRLAEARDGRRYLPVAGAKAALEAVRDDTAAGAELKEDAREAIQFLDRPFGRSGFFSTQRDSPAPPTPGDLSA